MGRTGNSRARGYTNEADEALQQLGLTSRLKP